MDNKKFTKELKEWHASTVEAKERGVQEPQMSDYIGLSICDIVKGFSNSPMFRRVYSKDRDEMISSGIETVLRSFKNFQPEKCTSGLAFVTTGARFGFMNSLTRATNQLRVKNAVMEAMSDGIFDMNVPVADINHHSASLDSLRDIVDQHKKDNKDDNEKYL